MKKIRSDSKWFALSRSQLATLEAWLLDDHLSYDDALARAKNELGFTGSKSSLQRFYHRAAHERSFQKLLDSAPGALQVNSAPVTESALHAAGMKLLGGAFFEQAASSPPAELPALAKLLLQSESNKIRREENDIRRESHEMRRRHLDFAMQRWQYDLTQEALERLPELNELFKAKLDEKDPFAECKRINVIRRRLFGNNVIDPLPENAEQKAAQETAEAFQAVKRRRDYEESLARSDQERQARQAKPNPPPPAPAAAAEPLIETLADYEPENRFPFNDPATVARCRKYGLGQST